MLIKIEIGKTAKKDADGKLAEHIKGIQDCYPPEIVEYYSPKYADQLMKKIDEFTPNVG